MINILKLENPPSFCIFSSYNRNALRNIADNKDDDSFALTNKLRLNSQNVISNSGLYENPLEKTTFKKGWGTGAGCFWLL